jgi:predicted RNA-binding Zn-ribbon protein involved in translation (DUF1610 family)
MSKNSDRIELEIGESRLVVAHAKCPAGCNLMDSDVRFHDHPSIHLAFTYQGQPGTLYLDPVYGRYEKRSDPDVPSGEVVSLSCPHCGISLVDPDSTCRRCSAPMFSLHLPRGGFVEACSRSGCAHHTMRLVTGAQLMQRMFDELGMDSYL